MAAGGAMKHDARSFSNDGVVPAQAGTHIPEPVVMGSRFRGDDSMTKTKEGVA
jgi:hypothetical protein